MKPRCGVLLNIWEHFQKSQKNMSVTKELIKKEKDLVQTGQVRDLHLHREGTFIRAYDWSA